jgi:hypothetical protein
LTIASRTSFIARLFVVVLAAGVFVACAKEQDSQQRRERLAMANRGISDERRAPPGDVLDSLRVMKARFGITREEYWDGQGGVLANDFFELWYPPGGTTVTHGMYAFKSLFEARKKFRDIFGVDPDDHLKVICAANMLSYREKTGYDWWVYSKVDDDQIYFQPVDILYQRTLADMAVARGYYEWGILRLSRHKAPEWLTQGLASLLSDEGTILEQMMREFPEDDVKMTLKRINSGLDKESDRETYRVAVYNAFRMVRRLAARYGRDKVAETILLMGRGEDRKTAFEKAFGEPYDDVVDYAMEFKVNL